MCYKTPPRCHKTPLDASRTRPRRPQTPMMMMTIMDVCISAAPCDSNRRAHAHSSLRWTLSIKTRPLGYLKTHMVMVVKRMLMFKMMRMMR